MPVDSPPGVGTIAKLFKNLLGVPVTVKEMDDKLVHGKPDTPTYAGVYASNYGDICAAAICSLSLAAATGACLGLIPTAQAEEWVKTRKIPADGLENFQEILNVIASAFNEAYPGRHVRLRGLLQPGQMPPQQDIRQLLDGTVPGINMGIDIDRYPSGRLTLRSR
jgi:hypothetical protein